MKKKHFILPALLLASVGTNAAGNDDIVNTTPLRPTYLSDVVETAGWDSNWFVEAKGGVSAFIGTPVGCGDIFDRTMPVLQVGVGKWFTPAFGGRVEYQGLQLKNAELQKMKYQHFHADFMYNITHHLQQDEYGMSKLDVIPFIGLGIIRNSDNADVEKDAQLSGHHPFAFNYGIQLRYHVYDRLHIIGEVSGMTTMQNFDGVGTSCHFGDNMLNVSVGLSYTLGKKGWRRVVDATPYIQQNNYLIDKCNEIMAQRQNADAAFASSASYSDVSYSNQGKNDYAGLRALRSRMSASEQPDTTQLHSDTIAIDVPIYFYFKLNSTKLVDKSQLANLDEIAKIAKDKQLKVHVSGAADKATGTSKHNRDLSKKRACYIAKQLKKRGITKDQLKASCLGGVSLFEPKEANRYGVVLLTID